MHSNAGTAQTILNILHFCFSISKSNHLLADNNNKKSNVPLPTVSFWLDNIYIVISSICSYVQTSIT